MRGDIRMNAVGGGAARNETAAAIILMSPKNSKTNCRRGGIWLLDGG
jgi:hypothetical protein